MIREFIGRKLITKEWLDPKDELIEARRNVCNSCPNKKDTHCKICLCDLLTKSETKVNYNLFVFGWPLEVTHCPIGKWPVRQEDGTIGGNDLEIANYYRTLNNKGKIRI